MPSFSAEKLKTNLRLAASRIKLQTQKKQNSVANEKVLVGRLLQDNKEDSARIKTEGIVREEMIIGAYNIIQLYIEELITRLPLITSSKGCPPECVTSVASLLYASTRVQIDEFKAIRALLGAKYGAAFVHKADTNADNAVNEKLVARLSLSVPQATVIEMYLQDICASQGIPYNTDVPMPMLSVPVMPMQPMQPMSLSPMPSPQPMQPMEPMQPMPSPQPMQPMEQPQPMAQAPQMPPSAPQDADAFPHPPAAPHGGAPGDDIDELMARLNALKK